MGTCHLVTSDTSERKELAQGAHCPLAATDEGHLGRHDGHELDIGVERERRHIHDGARNEIGRAHV